MATPAKRHVKRVFKIATNQDTGEQGLVTDLFVDVLRYDTLPVSFGSTDDGKIGQIITYKFQWNDDPNNPVQGIDASNADIQYENANAGRKTEQVRISDPAVPSDTTTINSVNDNDIALWVVDKLKTKLSGKDFPVGQFTQFVFDNNPADGSKGTPAKRETSIIKVVNNDLNGMKMTDANGNALLIDWGVYQQALNLGKTDPTDPLFYTVEVTDKFNVRFGADITPITGAGTGKVGQIIGYVLANQTIEQLFKQGDPKATNADGSSAVIRLDPLQEIVNIGSNIIAVKFYSDQSKTLTPSPPVQATRQVNNGGPTQAGQITISTWVYVSSKAVQAQNVANANIDAPAAGPGVMNRIPVMEFGNSVEPLVGLGIGFEFWYEHFLGQGYWATTIGAPSWPDYTGTFWIGGLGTGMDGWFPFARGVAHPSVSYVQGWTHREEIDMAGLDGTVATVAESAFYPRQLDPGFLQPIAAYSGFSDVGILPYGVMNKSLGQPFVRAAYSLLLAYPTTWTWSGHFTVSGNQQWPRVAVKDGYQAQQSKQVNSQVLFTNFYPSPFNWMMQPVPTPIVAGQPQIRVDTGGTGKYYAFGQLVVLFPQRAGVTYGKPAIPSGLYLDSGNVVVVLTGAWPANTTMTDQEIVPTLTFTGGGFKLDSWNHIFFTCDLTKMQLTGGQDDPTKREWVDTLAGKQEVAIPLSVPDLAIPPTWAMLINGVRVKATTNPQNPTSQLTVYPSATGHWVSTRTFNMALGQIGMPNITQEVGRYKLTGPSAEIEYAYTHIYFNKYIDPTTANLSKFVWRSTNKAYNNVIPPPDKKAAQKAFGTPDVWFYRDKANQVAWKNLGTAGAFTNIGTPPADFRPGPGQPARKPATAP